jgi:hypothetical protein
MKNKITYIGCFTLLLSVFVQKGYTCHYDLRFSEPYADETGSYYYLTVEMKIDGYRLGSANITCNYNDSALMSPQIHQVYNFNTAPYGNITLSEPLQGVLSINIVYNKNSGPGQYLQNNVWYKVLSFRLRIKNPDTCGHFAFRPASESVAPCVILRDNGSRVSQGTVSPFPACNILYRPKLFIKAFLEGPFDTDSMKMKVGAAYRDSFTQNSKEQSYQQAPWNYQGKESFINLPHPKIIDWVLITLRYDMPDSGIFDSIAGLITEEGRIISASGDSFLTCSHTHRDSFLIVLQHRNHISVMSSTRLHVQNQSASWDFTAAYSNTYSQGSNAIKAMGAGNTAPYALIAGNCNGDTHVNSADMNAWLLWNGTLGLYGVDLNMDLNINALDYMLYKRNLGSATHVPESGI